MTTATANEAKTIAGTIRRQIMAGDFWCLAACGARDYVALDRNDDRRGGLMFRVTITPRKFHKVIIELTHLDEYRVRLVKITRPSYAVTTVQERGGVYCDNLADIVYNMCNK